MMVDEGSRSRMARMVPQGKQKHVSAGQCLNVFKESWASYFGNPHTLRLDPDGSFRSHEVSEFCDRSRIFLDIIPGEAHWKLSACERGLDSVKYVMEAVVQEAPDTPAEQALMEAIRVLNTRENVRGYSPYQHVMGKAPDEFGRFCGVEHPHPELATPTEFEDSHQNRLTAEKAFVDWQAQQRLVRAQNSKHRGILDFQPGKLVFIWREQLTGEDKQQNKTATGRFVCPARILAVENKKGADGHLIPGSSVWVVRGRRLLKCCPEQLRRASEREEILEELHSTTSPTPWSFPRVAEELGGNEF